MTTNTITPASSRFRTWRLGRRATRQALVAAWVLCCAGLVTLGLLEINGAVWFVLFALIFAADVMLYRATHRLADLPTRWADERQVAVRDRAYRAAYIILFLAISLPVGTGVVLSASGVPVAPAWFAHPMSHPAILAGLGVAWVQAVSMLPTAVVAWSEPDEAEETE